MKSIVAVDVGYGWTKAISKNAMWRQPSVLGVPVQLFDDLRPGDIQYIGSEKYFIGDLALRQSTIKYSTTTEDKNSNLITRVLLQTGIGMVGDGEMNLIIGLPVSYYHKQKAAALSLVDAISGRGYDLLNGKEKRHCCPSVVGVRVVPQPLGSAMNRLLDNFGNPTYESSYRVLVIDVGYFTCDFLILDNMEINSLSYTPRGLGTDTAYKIIQSELMQYSGRLLNRNELDRIVMVKRFGGQDISDIVENAFKTLSSAIQFEIDNMNTGYDILIITGGWAAEVAKNIPGSKVVMDGFSNVQGFYKIGVSLWGA